jgi:hypothetical protein
VSTPEEDIRECFCHQIRFEVGLINELADMRMNGCEPPLNAAIVAAAARRTEIRRTLELAREDGCCWRGCSALPEHRPPGHG